MPTSNSSTSGTAPLAPIAPTPSTPTAPILGPAPQALYSVVSSVEPKVNRGPLQVIPLPSQAGHFLEVQRDNISGLIFVRITRDKGKTWRTVFSEPPASAPVGAVPMLQANGHVEWVGISQLDAVLKALEDAAARTKRTNADLLYIGDFVVNKVFGRFSVPSDVNYQCLGVEIAAQDSPEGSEVRVDIVNDSNAVQSGTTSVLPASTADSSTIFTTPFSMPASSIWRLKISQRGSSQAGGNAQFRLLLKEI